MAPGNTSPYPYPKRGKGRKPPRIERLIGFNANDLSTLDDAAALAGLTFTAFIRQAALLHALRIQSIGNKLRAEPEEAATHPPPLPEDNAGGL